MIELKTGPMVCNGKEMLNSYSNTVFSKVLSDNKQLCCAVHEKLHTSCELELLCDLFNPLLHKQQNQCL